MAKVRQTNVADLTTRKALTQIRDAMPDLDVFDGARQVDAVQLTAGQTKRVPHGLKRKLRGWFVVRVNSGAAAGYLYDQQSTHSDTDTYLYLHAEGFSPVVSLVVF